MSAVGIVIKLMTDAAPLAGVAGATIYPVAPPPNNKAPYYLVNLIAEQGWENVDGAARVYDSRVTVECIGRTATEAYNMGQAVIAVLEDVTKQTVNGHPSTDVRKGDTDVTDTVDATSSFRRSVDFSVNWRPATP